MRFESVKRSVTANIGLKVVSLLFAVLMWLYVTAQQAEKQTLTVPLELAGIPESLAAPRDVPGSIRVSVSATKSEILKLRFISRPKAVVDCSLARRGHVLVPLSPGVVTFPRGVAPAQTSIEAPRSLSLTFEPIERRYVPVRAAFKGELAKEMTLVGQPTVTPERVLLAGAASAMAGVSSVATAPIDLARRRSRISEEVGLDLGGRQVSAVPSKVRVEVGIGARSSRTISGITPTLLQVAGGMRVEFSPSTASLTVEGPEELVKRLTAEDVSIILNVTARHRGSYRIQPEVIVPAGIEKYTLDVETFEVIVTPVAGGEGASR